MCVYLQFLIAYIKLIVQVMASSSLKNTETQILDDNDPTTLENKNNEEQKEVKRKGRTGKVQ